MRVTRAPWEPLSSGWVWWKDTAPPGTALQMTAEFAHEVDAVDFGIGDELQVGGLRIANQAGRIELSKLRHHTGEAMGKV